MSRRVVLLVEDHPESRESLAYVLERRGFDVLQAANGKSALAHIRRSRLDGLILDLKLPDMDGLGVLDAALQETPGLPVIVVTGFATVDAAVAAMKRGATDFLTKPIQVDALLALLERCLGNPATGPDATDTLLAEMEQFGLQGRSRVMRELFATVKHVAPHRSTVLVLGESGTGKELIARALHLLGPRAAGPFVAINCAALTEELLENEIFGHERGAFTNAAEAKAGLMEVADGGTLFLDEVNEMGLACQAKLLRALERREFRRVGGTRKVKVDLNIIAASNAPLELWVRDGRFRTDLFYRLQVVTIVVPPLRDRTDAIPVLAGRFLHEAARQAAMPAKSLTPEAMLRLCRYAWPGNVRELRNLMESLTLMVRRPLIDVGDLPPAIQGAEAREIRLSVGIRIEDAEREIIRRTVESSPTLREAAQTLGIGLRTLHVRLRKYGFRRR